MPFNQGVPNMPNATTPPAALTLTISTADAAVFLPLFQEGVGVRIVTGVSLQDLMCRQWQLNPDYVSGRISTLFLNGRPVDDTDKALIRDGDILALSGAMPGLIGATMRRGGVLAPFRSGITHQADVEGGAAGERPGRITLKLFNLLIPEIGPHFLARGVAVSGRRIMDLGEAWAAQIDRPEEEVQIALQTPDP
jgi:hypothetical protein